MAVSNRLRFETFRRDGFACRYCGEGAPEAVLTIDHVVPRCLGGSDDPTNLVTACQVCNSGKSSTIAEPPNLNEEDDGGYGDYMAEMESINRWLDAREAKEFASG